MFIWLVVNVELCVKECCYSCYSKTQVSASATKPQSKTHLNASKKRGIAFESDLEFQIILKIAKW